MTKYTDPRQNNNRNNLIDGGKGNDTILGGAGNDFITLGAGADTLYYPRFEDGKGGADTVTDFTSGVDKILLEVGTNYQITGGGKTIIFKAAHSDGNTTLISGKDVFKVSDINFLG